jgi:hypothetical protein
MSTPRWLALEKFRAIQSAPTKMVPSLAITQKPTPESPDVAEPAVPSAEAYVAEDSDLDDFFRSTPEEVIS